MLAHGNLQQHQGRSERTIVDNKTSTLLRTNRPHWCEAKARMLWYAANRVFWNGCSAISSNNPTNVLAPTLASAASYIIDWSASSTPSRLLQPRRETKVVDWFTPVKLDVTKRVGSNRGTLSDIRLWMCTCAHWAREKGVVNKGSCVLPHP